MKQEIMKMSEIAAALNGNLVGKTNDAGNIKMAAIVIAFNPSSTKFQTPVKALGKTMNKIMTFELVSEKTYKVSDLRTKKTRTMTLNVSEFEKVLSWDKIESETVSAHTLKIETIKHYLYQATAHHKIEFLAKSTQYADANGLNTESFLKDQFETYENALSILAEKCLQKEMNAGTLKVSEKAGLKGGRLELNVSDGGKFFTARVIIASGIVQRPHYRYLFK